ncbi:MAG: hypothetical protein ACK49H_12635 [Burkholderiales bacterium]
MKRPMALPARGLLMTVVVLGSLAGCASVPAGPTWNAVPGSTRSVAQFQTDDAHCRDQSGPQAGSSQQRYDQLYYSCMYAHGHRVPAPARSAAGGLPPSGSMPAAGNPSPAGSGFATGASSTRPAPPPPPPGTPPAPPRSWLRG